MEHFHADVTENSYFIPGRSECFTGERAISEAIKWLSKEVESESEIDDETASQMIQKIDAYDGTTEAIEVEAEIPGNRPSYSVVMGFRIMSIDGDCDRTI